MERITAHELMARLEDENVTIIDVRARDRYEAAHVPGAIHIPVGDIKNEVPQLPKEHLIVTY